MRWKEEEKLPRWHFQQNDNSVEIRWKDHCIFLHNIKFSWLQNINRKSWKLPTGVDSMKTSRVNQGYDFWLKIKQIEYKYPCQRENQLQVSIFSWILFLWKTSPNNSRYWNKMMPGRIHSCKKFDNIKKKDCKVRKI